MADDTNATDAGQRYAQALFDLAKDENAVAPIGADLKSLKTAIHESADLRRLIDSPAFHRTQRSVLSATESPHRRGPLAGSCCCTQRLQ